MAVYSSACGTSVMKPRLPMFTPRMGTGRPSRSDAAWMRVPSPPRTTTRSAARAASVSSAITSTPLRGEEPLDEARGLERLRRGHLVDDPDALRYRARMAGHAGHYISESAMDLFDHAAEQDVSGKPLAERMRPRRLEDFVGQEHVLGPGTRASPRHRGRSGAPRSSCGGRPAPARPRSPGSSRSGPARSSSPSAPSSAA